jgi:hypothetical protein
MKITADQAFALAQRFHDLATAVGDYRFGHWNKLSKTQRDKLTDAQFTLLNNSSHFVTESVGLTLDDVKGDLKALQKVTANAQSALGTITSIKKAINLTASLVKLGAAIASENPEAIAGAIQDTANQLA